MSQTKEKCSVCLWDDKDDILYGDWMVSRKVQIHYFCLLSGTYINQKGTDKQGILGFLPRDIIASFDLYRHNECYLCGKKSAAVKCTHEGCDRFWHYPCGTRNGCMTKFCDKFESYCSRHVPDRNEGKRPAHSEFCQVCYGLMGTYNNADSIVSSCCLRLPDWYQCFVHKKCVLKYTKHAGYDSVCINCSMEVEGMTKETWQHEMRQKGIFVPMINAAWEQEGYFNDQVKNKCADPNCKQPNLTRNVYTCFVCGCYPKHLKCARVLTFEEYYCPKCFDQSFVQRVPRY